MDERMTGANARQVCIIGAGVTGLTAAYRLMKAGYGVTVIEQNPEPGGMLDRKSVV